jgi:hypothetical protein
MQPAAPVAVEHPQLLLLHPALHRTLLQQTFLAAAQQIPAQVLHL